MKKEEMKIIYQDDNILAVNKPAGMLVIPDQHTDESKTLVGRLIEIGRASCRERV